MKLEINNISKSYENKPVFSNLSFVFESDSLYFLKGKNGAGKSTLLNILSGNDLNYSGKLLLDGIEINKKNNISYTDGYISYFTQDSVVFDDMTCLDNILLPYPNKDKNRAIKLLNELGLSKCVDQNASNLLILSQPIGLYRVLSGSSALSFDRLLLFDYFKVGKELFR